MKKTLFTLIAAFIALPLFSQEIIHRDSIMQDASQSLLKSKVIELDSVGQQEIKQRIKNWAGQNFVNMNEVLVSETDNQLVFNYIEIYYAKVGNSLIECGEYTRMIVQIKDGKAKISLYDNGNRADRNIKITDWFKSNEVLENKGLHKTSFYALKDYSTSCKNTLLKLEKSISNKAEIAMEDF